MERLEKEFKPNTVLHAEELNGIVNKVNELVENIGSSGSVTLTQDEYNDIINKEMKWYVIVENQLVIRIYFGQTLIAKRTGGNTSNSFPYNFPITF